MITLGSTVRDSITKFTGIATSRTRHLHGCVHVGITPNFLHDGKPIEAQGFDEQRIVVLGPPVDGGVADEFPLGSKVADLISGFTGIATSSTVYLHALAAVAITSATLSDGKPIEPYWIDAGRVRIIEEKKPGVSEHSSASSGGPAGAIPRVRR